MSKLEMSVSEMEGMSLAHRALLSKWINMFLNTTGTLEFSTTC